MNRNCNLQNEAKATWSFGVLIQTHDNLLNFTSSCKKLVNLLFRSVKRHVPNVNGGWSFKRMLKFFLISRESSISVCRDLRRILKHLQRRKNWNQNQIIESNSENLIELNSVPWITTPLLLSENVMSGNSCKMKRKCCD